MDKPIEAKARILFQLSRVNPNYHRLAQMARRLARTYNGARI